MQKPTVLTLSAALKCVTEVSVETQRNVCRVTVLRPLLPNDATPSPLSLLGWAAAVLVSMCKKT